MVKDSRNIKMLLIFFAVILAIMAFKSANFFTLSNISDIMLNSAVNILAALAMLFVLLIGEIDVSVGSMIGVCGMTMAYMLLAGVPLALSLIGALLAGLILGAINGALVVFLKVESIIATLATMSIYRGLLMIVTNGLWVTNLPTDALDFGQAKLFNIIPLPIIIAIVVAVIIGFVLRKTVFGRNLYAVGSNRSSAYLSSINVNWTRMSAFLITGLLIGLAAAIFICRYNTVQSNTGKGYEMIAVASCVVGGASTVGAKGNALGTLLGAVLMSTISTLLIFFGVDSLWSDFAEGFIILAAVVLYAYNGKGISRKNKKDANKALPDGDPDTAKAAKE